MLSFIFSVVTTLSTLHLVPAPVPLVTIPLSKQHVPVVRQNRVVMNKTAYFGTISVGQPDVQNFTVVFDTGSGHVILPSIACESGTCKQHRQFDQSLSQSATRSRRYLGRAGPEQVEVQFGTGEVMGESLDDIVCLTPNRQEQFQQKNSIAQVKLNEREHTEEEREDEDDSQLCIDVRLLLAIEMTEEPFASFEFDGVLGLGLSSLAVGERYSFLGQLSSSNKIQQMFGVFLSEDDEHPSEISFGGFDRRRFSAPLRWVDVNNADLGYWQVRISGITVGSSRLPVCDDGTCVGILDSGTSIMGWPKQFMREAQLSLLRFVHDVTAASDTNDLDCRTVPGPDLIFHLEGMDISLNAHDYSRPGAIELTADALQAEMNSPNGSSLADLKPGVHCRATLLPVVMDDPMPLKTFILGEPALRRYYTVYDWGSKRVGFGESKQTVSYM